MQQFANLPRTERALLISTAAARLGLAPIIVEKDFWVCWSLARLFEVDAVAPHVVFKGSCTRSRVVQRCACSAH